MTDYDVLLRYYRDEDRPFPLPRLEGMYVRPRYAIYQHELDELLNAIDALRAENERLQRERDEALARLEDAHRRLIAVEHEIEEAEQNSRAKAIDEAAAVASLEKHNSDDPESAGYDPSWEKGWAECAAEIERAILALERKPE